MGWYIESSAMAQDDNYEDYEYVDESEDEIENIIVSINN